MVSKGWDRIFPITIKPGTYILSCQNQFGASTKGGAVSLTDENDTTIIADLAKSYSFGETIFIGTAATITDKMAEKIKNIRFALRSYGTTYADITSGNIQLELGSTATAYEPYTGNQISVTFPEAVYSGKVDAITGKLSKSIGPNQYFKTKLSAYTRKDENINGTGYTRYQFYPTVSGAIVGADERNSEKLCSIATYLFNDASATSHWYHNIDGTINLFVPDGTDENTEAEFIIPLATAQETQLDPQEMTTLYGTNNIWANTDDVTVTYIAKSAKFSFGSPLHNYNYNNLKLFGNTYIEHGKG